MNVPLRTLEAQLSQRNSLNQSSQSSLLPAAFASEKKRKTTNSLSSPGFSNTIFGQSSNYAISLGGNASSSGLGSPHHVTTSPSTSSGQGPSNPSKSLFASILALPPAKRARTIHNPEAPPVPPPPPPPSKRTPKKVVKKGKRSASNTRGRGADKKGKEKEIKSVVSRRRAGSISSTHTRSSVGAEPENVNDTDIKAAATLTDIFFSRAGGNVSPRSSLSVPTSSSRLGSGIGAVPLSQIPSGSSISGSNFSDYMPSSHTRSKSITSTGSGDAIVVDRDGTQNDISNDARRSLTPTSTPRLSTRSTTATMGSGSHGSGSYLAPSAPIQHNVDNEAADLMLLLANSPSPVRPSVPRDHDITRNVYAAGRVLFPTGSGGNSQHSDSSNYRLRGLHRNSDNGSFSSTASAELVDEQQREESTPSTSPPLSEARITSPVQSPESQSSSQFEIRSVSSNSRPNPSTLSLNQFPQSTSTNDPQTPTTFHIADYINVSPSPVAPASSHTPAFSSHSAITSGTSGRFRSTVNVSSPLRKSFDRDGMSIGVGGRRLFENDPIGVEPSGNLGGNPSRRLRYGENVEETASLGSGIDLVQT